MGPRLPAPQSPTCSLIKGFKSGFSACSKLYPHYTYNLIQAFKPFNHPLADRSLRGQEYNVMSFLLVLSHLHSGYIEIIVTQYSVGEMTFILRPFALSATILPMWPAPIIPKVLLKSSRCLGLAQRSRAPRETSYH